jgi:hypothetical protein
MALSADLISDHRTAVEVRDGRGRTLKVRHLNALDRLRLLKAAGPDLSRNDAWLDVAALAASVTEIEGIPRIMPVSERQIEAIVLELGDIGLEAVANALSHDDAVPEATEGDAEGNRDGTPT